MEKGQWGAQGMGRGNLSGLEEAGFFNCLLQTCWTKFCFRHVFLLALALCNKMFKTRFISVSHIFTKILSERANELVIN